MLKTMYFVFLCYLNVVSAVIYELTDEQYEWMPPLLRLDPYSACMKHPRALYCTAHITYVADRHNELLHMMQEFSEHTVKHFNHTRAMYGICVTSRCKHLYKNETEEDLHRVLGACLNETLYKEYQLKVVTEDIQCNFEGHENIEINGAFNLLAWVFMLIVILNIGGSLYDVFSFETNQGMLANFLLCFSIPRNWRLLNAPAAAFGDPRLQKLKSIHCLRGGTMVGVVLSHVILPLVILARNPKFFEDAYKSNVQHVLLNGTACMQTYLVISSFLLIYKLELHSEHTPFTWPAIPHIIIRRWFRLTPAYALILGFTATWMRYLGSGPIWAEHVTKESLMCETHWWEHLLYINNYNDESQCMIHTWYVATDSQLFVLAVLVYYMYQKLNRNKGFLYALLVLSVVVPAINTYVEDLDGIFVVKPETVVGKFINDVNYNKTYRRGHVNIFGYAIGICLGFLVYYLQKTQFDINKYKCYRPLYWLIIPIALALLISCKVFYADAPRPHILIRVLATVTVRPLFALLMAFLLFGAVFEFDNFYRNIMEWNGWTFLSRVSYSIYMTHLTVVKYFLGMQEETIITTFTRMVEFSISLIFIIYFIGTMFYLLVESPFGNVSKMCFDVPSQKIKEEKKVL